MTNDDRTAKIQSIRSAMAHSIGQVRPVNEDAIFTFTSEKMCLDRVMPVGLYIIADGMGGHSYGERASALAVNEFCAMFFAEIYPKIDRYSVEDDSELFEDLQRALLEANCMIETDLPGSGTTFSALLLYQDRYAIVHIGDSRIYKLANNSAPERMTKDHSLVQMMIDLGEITEDEAQTHPRRNVILKSLGFEETALPDLTSGPVQAGDGFLLCCDGVWSVIERNKFEEILAAEMSLEEKADRLVCAANDAGGPDNISCILVETH